MPDQLAHFLFARRVLAAAPKHLVQNIRIDSAAFRAGTFGPDPLFNDPSPRRRAEGFELHRQPGRVSLERMRQPVKEKIPWAADYAAGFFCHYALDRICHPDIKAMAARGEARHLAIEIAYERQLWQRGERNMPRRIPLGQSAALAAAQMYRRITPGRYKLDLEAYWQLRRFLMRSGGTHLAPLLGKVRPEWDGFIAYDLPSPQIRQGIEMLDGLMEDGVAPAAEQLGLYLEAIEKNEPLHPWTDADFSGFQTLDSLTNSLPQDIM